MMGCGMWVCMIWVLGVLRWVYDNDALQGLHLYSVLC